MKPNRLRTTIGALAAAATLGLAGAAFAQADNSNSATDPTYYDMWYFHNAPPSVAYYRDEDYARPSVYVFGPTTHTRGPAYYEPWRYYDPPVRYYASPSITPLGTVTQPGYMGPRDVRP